jgi:hypothetical protein
VSVDDQDPAGELLIKEVDEDLRREQYIRLWQAYGKFAIAGILAIVLGVAGHQVWQAWRDKQFEQTAAAFASAEDLLGADKKSEAEAKLSEIAKSGQAGFAMTAAFRKAELQSAGGDAAGAVASYDAIAKSDAPVMFRDLATLKGVLLTLDNADPETLLKKVQPLADAGNPWHYTATELLALLASRRGDKAGAVGYYQKLADDAAAPQDIRARAVDMIAALGGGPAAAKPEKG